jgi:hypothetical protein
LTGAVLRIRRPGDRADLLLSVCHGARPADRFWTFQGIDAGIFLVLTGALLTFAYRRITTADA